MYQVKEKDTSLDISEKTRETPPEGWLSGYFNNEGHQGTAPEKDGHASGIVGDIGGTVGLGEAG